MKTLKEVISEYYQECLDTDGDYSMSFQDWLEIHYPNTKF